MEDAIGIECNLEASGEGRPAGGNSATRKTVERLAILDWYRILRVHHHWAVFQAVRFALWLAR